MKYKKNDGITISALVITVIVILILAIVAVSAITNNGSMFEKANAAGTLYNTQATNEAELVQQLTDVDIEDMYEVETSKDNFKICKIEMPSRHTLKVSGINDIVSMSVIQDGKAIDTVLSDTYCPVYADPGENSNIFVYAMDKDGYIYKSNTITFEGKGLCLYDEGEQCIDVTGGWVRGYYNCGSVDIDTNDYMYIEGISGKQLSNSINTNNLIDCTGYSKFYIEVEFDQVLYWSSDKTYYTYFLAGLANPRFAGYSTVNIPVRAFSWGLKTDIPKNTKLIYSVDIPAGTKGYPTAAWANYNSSMPSPAHFKIHRVWLEK